MSPEVAARVRRAIQLAFVARLAPGVVLLVVVLWRYSTQKSAMDTQWLLMLGAVLVATLVHQTVNRHRPALWTLTNVFSTLLVGFIAGAMTAEHSEFVREALTEQSVRNQVCAGVGAASGALLGWLLGRWAVRRTLEPFTVELADSPLEIPFRIRGSSKQIVVSTIRLTVEAPYARKSGWTKDTHSLVDIEQVASKTLTDGESTSDAFPRGVRATPGLALRFVDDGQPWLVPTDQAEQAVQFITRRVAAANAAIQ